MPSIPLLGFFALVLAWLLPGLIGHDPWKPDEAYTFGLVNHIVATGEWVIPRLAGEPFMEKPTLFFLSAAAFQRVFSGIFTPHDASRLAAGFWMAAAFLAIALSARQSLGKNAGAWAVVILLGCLGLPVRAHQMITDTALFCGMAWGIYGLTLVLKRPGLAGVFLGIGGSITFLSKGLLGPGCLGLTALLLPIFYKKYRSFALLKTLGLAIVIGMPLPLFWMGKLYALDPALFRVWFFDNNFSRYSGESHLGPTSEPFFYLKLLPWYAFPALPFACIGAVKGWKKSVGAGTAPAQLPQFFSPELAPVVLSFFIILLVLGGSADARELYAMPLLIPLSLLAVTGLYGGINEQSARQISNGWPLVSFSLTAFAFLVAILLFLGAYALATGEPSSVFARLPARSFSEWTPKWHGANWGAFLFLLVVISVLWRKIPAKEATGFLWRWALFVVLMWGSLGTAWLPAIDSSMRYRDVFLGLAPFLQEAEKRHECVASFSLGEPQRAMLDYYVDAPRPKRLELSTAEEVLSCRWLLVQNLNDHLHGQLPEITTQGELVFSISRPSEQKERFFFYHFPQGIGVRSTAVPNP